LFIVLVGVISYGSAMHEPVAVRDCETRIDEPAFWERQAMVFIAEHKTRIECCRELFFNELEEIYSSACRNIAQGNDKKVLEDIFVYTHYPRVPVLPCLCVARPRGYDFEQALDELMRKRKLLEALQSMHHALGCTLLDSPDAHFFLAGHEKVIFTGENAKPLAERVKYLSAALLAQLLFGDELC
jgi:hypothetical protein